MSTLRPQWFDKKKSYLEALESQLRSLVKAIEAVAKQRSGKSITPTLSLYGFYAFCGDDSL
jgi:hypothetical protein